MAPPIKYDMHSLYEYMDAVNIILMCLFTPYWKIQCTKMKRDFIIEKLSPYKDFTIG